MTELETLQRAKHYIDQLAKGIDPITGMEVPEGEVINQVRLSRCLYYVAGVLQKVIDNGGKVGAPEKKSQRDLPPFELPYGQRSHYPMSDTQVSISVIAQHINDLVDPETMQKLKVTSF